MGFCPDIDSADKVTKRKIGKQEKISCDDFYKLFSKSILKVALTDMLNTIEEMFSQDEETPLYMKLANYRRNLMLSGLDHNMSPDFREAGQKILHSLVEYKVDKDPLHFKKVDFEQFIKDPTCFLDNEITDDQRMELLIKNH